jgi:hypothetical protein
MMTRPQMATSNRCCEHCHLHPHCFCWNDPSWPLTSVSYGLQKLISPPDQSLSPGPPALSLTHFTRRVECGWRKMLNQGQELKTNPHKTQQGWQKLMAGRATRTVVAAGSWTSWGKRLHFASLHLKKGFSCQKGLVPCWN